MVSTCSLVQVGEYDIVLDIGGRVLEKWEARSMRRDVLFAMALAHLGLATDALDAKDKVPIRSTLLYLGMVMVHNLFIDLARSFLRVRLMADAGMLASSG